MLGEDSCVRNKDRLDHVIELGSTFYPGRGSIPNMRIVRSRSLPTRRLHTFEEPNSSGESC